MRGAVAAGHPLTAEAGARVLAAGGNAVDACVGAAFASWVCESMLTGPGGGGFMLVHGAGDGRTRVFDFMVTVPRAATAAAGELLRLAVDFDGDTQQVFHTGAAAVAVPGTALGLEAAHRRFGRVPWAELVAPAAQLAREGVELTPAQGYLHRILDGLLRHSPEGDAMYGAGGRAYRAGERFALPELAETLERIGAEGAAALYRGELARRVVEHVRAGGGALSLVDLAGYRVTPRRPVTVEYRGHEFRSNPPPSSGGLLVAYGLKELGDAAPAPEALVAAMEAQDAVRGGTFVRALHRGGVARAAALGDDAHLGRGRARRRGLAVGVAGLRERGGRARDGHPPEQHARRSGPARARAAGGAVDVDDGAVARLEGRPPAPRSRIRRLSAPARRHPPDRRERRSERDGCRGSR